MRFLLLVLCLLLASYVIADDIPTEVNISNELPVASSASINSENQILLSANATAPITGTVTITDANGCGDIDGVVGKLYRTNVSGGSGAPDNRHNHYTMSCDSDGDCTGGEDTTDTYSCSFDLYWYADPTDIDARFSGTDWTFVAIPRDNAGNGTSDSDTEEIATLSALSVHTLSLDFGTLGLGEDTGLVNQQAVLENQGNEGLDIYLSGFGAIQHDDLAMVCTVGSIDINNMEYSLSSFEFGTGTVMTSLETEVDFDLPRGNESIPSPLKSVYLGLALPSEGVAGSCWGALEVTSISDPWSD